MKRGDNRRDGFQMFITAPTAGRRLISSTDAPSWMLVFVILADLRKDSSVKIHA